MVMSKLGVRDAKAGWLVYSLLAISLLAFFQLARLEFGARHALPLHPDELLFLTCAAREMNVGEMFGAGCHDNKAPLIYWAYEVLLSKADPYSFFNLKVAAFALGGLLLLMCGWIAYFLAGAAAAMLAVALGLQIFTVLPSLLALKTELLGMFFVLAGTAVLLRASQARPVSSCFAAGLLFGLAMLSKQTFVFATVAAGAWLFFVGGRRWSDPWAPRLRDVTVFFAAVVLVFIAIYLYLWGRGQHIDFLASTFLYPSLYAIPDSAPWLQKMAWRLGALGDMVQPLVILNLIAVAAVVALGQHWRQRPAAAPFSHAPQLLVAGVMLAMLLVPVIAPISFRFHFLPAWLMMAIFGGIYAAPYLAVRSGAHGSADFRPVQAALLAYFVTTALYCWYGLPGRADRDSGDYDFRPIDLTPGGYVFGLWPELLVTKGYIMASAITAPQVLRGAPTSWGFIKPVAGSIKGQALEMVQSHSDQRLRDDFARNPPKYILLTDEATGGSKNSREVSIAVLNDYVTQHCRFERWIAGIPRVAGNLFSCKTAP